MKDDEEVRNMTPEEKFLYDLAWVGVLNDDAHDLGGTGGIPVRDLVIECVASTLFVC